MKIDEIESYIMARIAEVKSMCKDGTPWVFLCANSLIDIIDSLYPGADGFPRIYLKKYYEFKYKDGMQDFYLQFITMMECMQSNFSFVLGDDDWNSFGSRNRSILLSHDPNDGHLRSASTPKAPDACIINADQFIDDIHQAAEQFFTDAKNDPAMRKFCEEAVSRRPFIGTIDLNNLKPDD